MKYESTQQALSCLRKLEQTLAALKGSEADA